MAKINNRPPFHFKLQKEMDIDNEKFFFIKKSDMETKGNSRQGSVLQNSLSMSSKDKMMDIRATAVNVSTRM